MKVEVVTCILGQAFGQAVLAHFGHLEVPSSWHHNFLFPLKFWVKHGTNDIWYKLSNMQKEWDQKGTWAENGMAAKWGSWQGFDLVWQLSHFQNWGI